jgi:hypothetical protein
VFVGSRSVDNRADGTGLILEPVQFANERRPVDDFVIHQMPVIVGRFNALRRSCADASQPSVIGPLQAHDLVARVRCDPPLNAYSTRRESEQDTLIAEAAQLGEKTPEFSAISVGAAAHVWRLSNSTAPLSWFSGRSRWGRFILAGVRGVNRQKQD